MYNVSVDGKFMTITNKDVTNLLSLAVEGTVTDWCLSIKPHKSNDDNFYVRMLEGFDVIDDDGHKYKVTPKNINFGLQLMAERHRNDFKNVILKKSDAVTADTFLQLCVFNKLIYS